MKRLALALVLFLCAWSLAATAAEVTFEVKPYGGWERCGFLSNGAVELVATLEVGPRLIRYGFVGDDNILKEYEDLMGTTGSAEWQIYGGHRFWHAPESWPRTYAPDNAPVTYAWDGTTLTLTPPPEDENGVQKQLEVTMDPDTGGVTVLHRMTNLNPWPITAAPWCLTVMRQGGVGVYPQEPYAPHGNDNLLPVRPLVLWSYTDMADERWTWGSRYILLEQDPDASGPQKAGMLNKQGWMAYLWDDLVFIKTFPYVKGAAYPDYNCNVETYTDADMLELESLGPLAELAADNGMIEYAETWRLFKEQVRPTEEDIGAKVVPRAREMQ
jgi:hypothetical protein